MTKVKFDVLELQVQCVPFCLLLWLWVVLFPSLKLDIVVFTTILECPTSIVPKVNSYTGWSWEVHLSSFFLVQTINSHLPSLDFSLVAGYLMDILKSLPRLPKCWKFHIVPLFPESAMASLYEVCFLPGSIWKLAAVDVVQSAHPTLLVSCLTSVVQTH